MSGTKDLSNHRLSIAARAENLAKIRSFVREATLALGASPDSVAGLVLAADEICSNIIAHGYRGRGGIVELEIERQGDRVLVRVRDQAPPFDPTRVPAPDVTLPLEQRPLGGLGVFLARRVVDDMSHRVTDQGGNELTLAKRVDVDCN